MQSRGLSEDGRAGMHRWHIRRRRGDGRPGRLSARFAISAIAATAVLVLSCGDGAVEPAPPPTPVATTVAVSPGSAALSALAETARFTAEVRDQNGQVMAGTAVAWASSNASVASVDATGLATSAGNGTATITATAGSGSGTAAVTVAQVVIAVVLSPAADTLVAFGDTVRLVAEATDANGHGVAAVTEFVWSSSDTLVARVDDSGLVTGVDEGTATITATASEYSGTAEVTTVENTDRTALVALYEATDGPNWIDNTNWLTDAPLGEWYGVETDASGRVVGIRLDGVWEGREQVPHGLLGPIPPELGRLTSLEVLSLRINAVTGTIPSELGNLANLRHLNLGLNRLFGVIPPEFGGIANLETLSLRGNVLTGTIPQELGDLSNLRVLSLRDNELTGPIPPELADLVRLSDLDLGWNNLTGTIPPSLGGLAGLRDLNLRQNDLAGPIPPELANLANLRWLLLDGNNLTGRIPPELANIEGLWWLWLYDNGLTGPIPPELGGLANLTSLSLSSNALTGPIPPELGKLTHLRNLNLNNNELTGAVPTELGSLAALEGLTLTDNLLTGSLPLSFIGLNRLQTIGCRRTEGVCLPATDEFREWARQVEARGNIEWAVDIAFCDEIDADALESLHEATNGSGWTRSDGWLEDENLDRWHGVRTDSIGRVSGLDLSGNALSGHVPEALGLLASLTELRIGDNALSGRLPLSLTEVQLEELDYRGTSLCVADDAGFQDWLNGIPRHTGTGVPCPPLTNRDILELLYRNADGRNWNENTGWLTDAPLAEWHGVETDAAGRVVVLRLPFNGLSGRIPIELGELDHLEWLDLAGNQLYGGIPSELGGLSELRGLDLFRNRISGTIPPELGDLVPLRQLSLRDNELTGEIPEELANLADLARLDLKWNFLSGSIPAALGNLSRLERLELVGNQLSGSIPSELGRISALISIRLADNQLTGRIPPELGTLDRLSAVDFSRNRLSGSIPSALGGLAGLQELRLSGNEISGSIPSDLGRSGDLWALELSDNQLSGSIPSELGRLGSLVTLDLGNNALSGALPAELGRATNLEHLDLRSNALNGPVPPEFGSLTLLDQLILADNSDLAGPMPSEILAIGGLERLMAGGTGLCWPPDAAWAAWFRGIADRHLVRCDGGAAAYLTQSVQSWDDPVPLLAGKPALLRVFVTAAQAGTATMPDVRATFFVDGAERHSVDIAATTRLIPSEVMEGDLALSANAEIPDWVIVPGLEMVIEVDPEGTLDSALGVTKRIPEEGRMAIDVRSVQPLRLTLIPFLWETEPDSSVVESVSAMAADPDGHELLRDVRMLLPIAELAVSARQPVITSTQDISRRLAQVDAMRVMEGGSGYWMGVWQPNYSNEFSSSPAATGVARLAGWASMSTRNPSTIAHELGHNLSLKHAPCGNPRTVDPWFPHFGGSIGAWGYDFGRNALVTPHAADVMSYCTHGIYWTSDFFFNKALSHRLANGGTASAAMAAEAVPVRSLLIWGGRDQDGVPYLDPAFVVDAVPSLPVAGGEYTIEGATVDGTPVFSFAFDMPHIGDAEGEETSFVFALPVRPGWGDKLASITLSGPGGSAVLDETTDQPMAILRDAQTGEVRGFLRDPAPATQAAADAVGQAAGQRLETLFSRGIPDGYAWRR